MKTSLHAPQNAIWCLLLIIFFLPACNESPEQIADPSSAIRAQWDTFIEHWEKEDAEQLVLLYTEDGINVPPGFQENEGRQQILEFYNMLFSNNLASKYEHQINALHHDGRMAVEYGEFKVHWTRNDSTEWTYQSRSLTHWVYSEDGDWKINLFLFNPPPEDTSD